jgi:hypothetical protein
MIVMNSRMDKIRKFMLQEEEDDDELFLVLLPTIYSSLYEEKRHVHTSSLPGDVYENTSILVDSVGPSSAEVCRTAASFP